MHIYLGVIVESNFMSQFVKKIKIVTYSKGMAG